MKMMSRRVRLPDRLVGGHFLFLGFEETHRFAGQFDWEPVEALQMPQAGLVCSWTSWMNGFLFCHFGLYRSGPKRGRVLEKRRPLSIRSLDVVVPLSLGAQSAFRFFFLLIKDVLHASEAFASYASNCLVET